MRIIITPSPRKRENLQIDRLYGFRCQTCNRKASILVQDRQTLDEGTFCKPCWDHILKDIPEASDMVDVYPIG